MPTSKTDWYCSLPWTGFSNDPDGRTRPCCIYRGHIQDDAGQDYYVQTHTVKEIFTSSYMRRLRQQFRGGQKPDGCQVCIRDESNGYTSKRIKYLGNRGTGFSYDFNSEPEYPVEYQMILSNACNLKCRSCTPSHSSSWQSEHHSIWGHTGYSMPHGQSGDRKSVLWSDRHDWMRHIRQLEIVGGEPFYIKQWQILWDELIERGLSRDITIFMSSNGTIYAEDVLRRLRDNFRHLSVGLSIDGLGSMYEYLRHPGRWDEVSKNLLSYHQTDLNFGYTHTIGWLNAWQVPDFHGWVHTNTPRFQIWNNIIHNPRHMSLVCIPSRIKDMIQDRWSAYNWGVYQKDIEGILNFMRSEQPTDVEIKVNYQEFARYDRVRGENVLDVIPEQILPYVREYFE